MFLRTVTSLYNRFSHLVVSTPEVLALLKTCFNNKKIFDAVVNYMKKVAAPAITRQILQGKLKDQLQPFAQFFSTNADKWLEVLCSLFATAETYTFTNDSRNDEQLEGNVLGLGSGVYHVHNMGDGRSRNGFGSDMGSLWWRYRLGFGGDQSTVEIDDTVRQCRTQLVQPGGSLCVTFFPLNWSNLKTEIDLRPLAKSNFQFRDEFNEYKFIGYYLEATLNSLSAFHEERTSKNFLSHNRWQTSLFEEVRKVCVKTNMWCLRVCNTRICVLDAAGQYATARQT
jgi:hypothetical protein